MISTHFQPVDVRPSSQYFPGYHPTLLAHFSWEITASWFCTPVIDHWAPDSRTTRYPRTSVWTSWVQEQLLCHLLLLHIGVYTAATLVFHTTYTWLSHFQGNPQSREWALSRKTALATIGSQPLSSLNCSGPSLVGEADMHPPYKRSSSKAGSQTETATPKHLTQVKLLSVSRLSNLWMAGRTSSPDLIYCHPWGKIE